MSINLKLLLISLFIFSTSISLFAQNKGNIKIDSISAKGNFPLVVNGKTVEIFVDKQEEQVVHIASNCFANDVELVSNQKPIIVQNANDLRGFAIIAGTIDKSALIKQLVAEKKLNANFINEWETFSISLITNPFKGVKQALVIAGSDERAVAYGLFELSRKIGVQPFNWWADIVPAKMKNIFIEVNEGFKQSPSVKYRGIFLNDEDWGLHPWAAENIDQDVKDIGPKTYAKVFELLLRLKANYIWPAMHPTTKAFWFYKENAQMAKKYAIVVGASHCEPMLRNNVFEWAENYKNEYGIEPNEWRYDLNKDQIFKYWDDRVKESANNDAVYTVGMRGIHDGGMPGPNSLPEKKKLLEQVISDQREMLQKDLSKQITSIPQIFCPYKEVLDIYQTGMKLPDDVTIAWADDNHGYIRQLSNPNEQKRTGKSGVYYHLSYWGAPEDYLWLSSTSPALISSEMSKAYHFGADRLWVFNVGDIKPAELEMQFALDLAWDVKKWNPLSTNLYLKEWATAIFGDQFSEDIVSIKSNYYRLAASGKPEHINKVKFTKKEVDQRLADYKKLLCKADSLKTLIPTRLNDAFFELIYYPVAGASLMNQKIFYAQKSKELESIDTKEALHFAKLSVQALNHIIILTEFYNEKLAGGKWKKMMDWQPREREVFQMPSLSKSNIQDEDKLLTIDISKPSNSRSKANNKFITIPNLGISGLGLTLSEFDTKIYNQENVEEASFVEYTFLPAEKYSKVTLKCLPNFRIYDGLNLRYAIAVNNEKPVFVDVNSKAESEEWETNVLRGYSAGVTDHKFLIGEKSIIRIYFPDPGLVLSSLEIN